MSKKVSIEKLAEIIALSIQDLTKEELEELTQILEEKYGLKPSEAVVKEVVAEEADEVKTEFNVILVAKGAKALGVVKAWKGFSGLSLMESKAQIDEDCPITLKEGVSIEEANSIKEALEAVGAEVNIA